MRSTVKILNLFNMRGHIFDIEKLNVCDKYWVLQSRVRVNGTGVRTSQVIAPNSGACIDFEGVRATFLRYSATDLPTSNKLVHLGQSNVAVATI